MEQYCLLHNRDMILESLQHSPEHLFTHFGVTTNADLTWITPQKDKIHLTEWSKDPLNIYTSKVLGLPEQYITIR